MRIGILLLAVLLSACATLPEGETSQSDGEGAIASAGAAKQNSAIVWSDDGKALALAVSVNDPTDPKRQQHQIVVQHIDGSDRKTISQVRKGTTDRLYYMKSAGYVVTRHRSPEGLIRADKIDTKGKEITIIELRRAAKTLCPNGEGVSIEAEVIPSPDGDLLALVYSQDCNEVTVEFIKAKDLQALDGFNLPLEDPVKATWHSGGYLVLANTNGKQAWRVAPKQAPKGTAYPKCLFPTTTSSAIARDGQSVRLEQGQVQLQPPQQAGFPCQ